MDNQDALRKVMQFHKQHLMLGESDQPYPASAFEQVLDAMGTLAQQAQHAPPAQQPTGDSLYINAAGTATKVSVKLEKNSKSLNWEVRVEDAGRGAEDLASVQQRVEAAIERAFERMCEKYGAPTEKL